jgi:peptidyl-prolyl cis-trans isomerase A (cyclophilin A)
VNRRLLTPAALNATAPAEYRVAFDTTAGSFVILVRREWAPRGADRFYNLVKNGFYDQCGFFRVVPFFMVEFGIHADPSVQAVWRRATIADDPVKRRNTRGAVSFATEGPNTRTTLVFINYKDNPALDAQGIAPFGEVVDGMESAFNINPEYKDLPDQRRIQAEGDAYLVRAFPRLSHVRTARIEVPAGRR